MIEPKVLKGFRDMLPRQESARRVMLERIEGVFRSFGFVPIDTPALEYAEILLGKGGGETEKQVYRFTDHGGRDVALRFDLTVPFARFAAAHRDALVFPFKRYHIGKVWRGENTQKGRYREFTQCDFDIVGSGSAAADFEIILMIKKALAAAGSGGVTIRLNHRGLFNRFLAKIGAAEHAVAILRLVDKLAKIGKDAAAAQLEEIAGADVAARTLEFTGCGESASWEDTLSSLKELAGPGPDTERLEQLRSFMKDTDSLSAFVLDPSITRGLDYYTGVVFESFLDRLPGIGSVCSGGRYDNLTGLYAKEPLSGVGASVGLDRLQAALEELAGENAGAAWTMAAVACMGAEKAGKAQALAEQFRALGVSCEALLEPKTPGQQFMLAEKKGVPWVIVPASDGEGFTLRNIASREDRACFSVSEAAGFIMNRYITNRQY